MISHEHDWAPIDGVQAGYRCPCGARGRRDLRTGLIAAVRAGRERVVKQIRGFPAVAKSARRPSLSEQEARMGAPQWER